MDLSTEAGIVTRLQSASEMAGNFVVYAVLLYRGICMGGGSRTKPRKLRVRKILYIHAQYMFNI